MNPCYLGDSFDIVKRFFCKTVKGLGYDVFIDPMLTGKWEEKKEITFYRFLGVRHVREWSSRKRPSALFGDPDTGVKKQRSSKHVSFDKLASELETHTLVFAFDQSFSHGADAGKVIRGKLDAMRARGCHGLYYNSHARFLFVAQQAARLALLRQRLHKLGMPASRLVEDGT